MVADAPPATTLSGPGVEAAVRAKSEQRARAFPISLLSSSFFCRWY